MVNPLAGYVHVQVTRQSIAKSRSPELAMCHCTDYTSTRTRHERTSTASNNKVTVFTRIRAMTSPVRQSRAVCGVFVPRRFRCGGVQKQSRGVEQVLFQCWASVADAGPTLKQNWFDVECLQWW